MEPCYLPQQIGYDSSIHIKKISSTQFIDSPETNQQYSQGYFKSPNYSNLQKAPIWRQLLSNSFLNPQYNSQFNPQNTYQNQQPCNCPQCFPPQSHFNNSANFPVQNNQQQMPCNCHQCLSNSGNQNFMNQPNYLYQNNFSNSNFNPNFVPNSNQNQNNCIKTGYNIINQYNNQTNFNNQGNSNYSSHSLPQKSWTPFPPNGSYSPTKQNPISKSQQYHTPNGFFSHKLKNKQSMDQFAMNKSQKRAWVDWNVMLNRIKHEIKSSDVQTDLVSFEFWDYVLDKLKLYFLNKKNTIYFLNLLKEYFKIDPEQSNFDAIKFFKKFGAQFSKFETNLYFEHKIALQYAKFISPKNTDNSFVKPVNFLNLTFNMTNAQTLEVAKSVYKLCDHDLDAFSFLSLYLLVSIEKGLTLESYQLVESELKSTIQLLNKEYPPSKAQSFSSNLFDSDIKIPYEKPKIFFESPEPSENFKHLQEFVFKKVDKARLDESKFRRLVQNVCLKHGYNFKFGHKIKLDNNKYAMLRTIEKILQDIHPKYQQKIIQTKYAIIKAHQERKSYNGVLHAIVSTQIQTVSKIIGQILTQEKSVEFNIKDLLRAKCSFSSIESIRETVNDLKAHILNFPDCQLIETKNNLSKHTKDYALIIKLPNCIAQLQLVLNLNSVANEFNHKIYEMHRTKLLNPVTNLYFSHNKWSQKFFTKFFDLFSHFQKSQNEPKIDEKTSLKYFQEDTKLFKTIVRHFSELKNQRIWQVRDQDANEIEKEFNELSHLMYKDHDKMSTYTDDERMVNEIQFFVSAKEYSKAKEYFEKIEKVHLEKNQILLELYTEMLFQNQQFGECLEESFKLTELYFSPGDKIKLAKKIGDIYMHLPDLYEKALQQYSLALEMIHESEKEDVKNHKSKLKDSQKITEADILNCIGMVYLKQGNLEKALSKLAESQILYKKNKKGNSIQMASSFVNVGRVKEQQGKLKQAQDNYKASLEIIQKHKGKYSVETAHVLRRLSSVYKEMENLEDALDYAKEAYEISEHILGKDHSESKKCMDTIEICRQQVEVKKMLGACRVE